MNSIVSATGSSSAQPAATATRATTPNFASGLGQTDFLKLLMAQMKHQDPSSPTSATDYVTQMAQFSSVQGITQLNQSISNLVSLQGLTQSVNLIGKTVTYANAAGQTATGKVSSVAMVGGQAQLVINNTNVGLGQIQGVQASAKSSAVGAASA